MSFPSGPSTSDRSGAADRERESFELLEEEDDEDDLEDLDRGVLLFDPEDPEDPEDPVAEVGVDEEVAREVDELVAFGAEDVEVVRSERECLVSL